MIPTAIILCLCVLVSLFLSFSLSYHALSAFFHCSSSLPISDSLLAPFNMYFILGHALYDGRGMPTKVQHLMLAAGMNIHQFPQKIQTKYHTKMQTVNCHFSTALSKFSTFPRIDLCISRFSNIFVSKSSKSELL